MKWRLFRSRNGSRLSPEYINILGFRPKNDAYFELVLRDRGQQSNGQIKRYGDNERLEFLGDAILDAIISHILYNKFPDRKEGSLSHTRATLVSRKHLQIVAKNIGLCDLVDQTFSGKIKRKGIYGDALEALVGAVYLDQGYDGAYDFVLNKILNQGELIDEIDGAILSHKAKLLEWGQQTKTLVKFKLIKEDGEPHNKVYSIQAMIGGEPKSIGKAKTIKEAEEIAAEKFYQKVILEEKPV